MLTLVLYSLMISFAAGREVNRRCHSESATSKRAVPVAGELDPRSYRNLCLSLASGMTFRLLTRQRGKGTGASGPALHSPTSVRHCLSGCR